MFEWNSQLTCFTMGFRLKKKKIGGIWIAKKEYFTWIILLLMKLLTREYSCLSWMALHYHFKTYLKNQHFSWMTWIPYRKCTQAHFISVSVFLLQWHHVKLHYRLDFMLCDLHILSHLFFFLPSKSALI